MHRILNKGKEADAHFLIDFYLFNLIHYLKAKILAPCAMRYIISNKVLKY